MPDQKHLQDLIQASIKSAIASPTDKAILAVLKKQVEDWDERDYPEKDAESEQIIGELQSLISYLEKQGCKEQSDAVFRILVHNFPESQFAAVAVASKIAHVHIDSLETADFGMDSEKDTNGARLALNSFEKHYRLVLQNLEQLANEVEMKLFREQGSGSAGELYRVFVRAAEATDNTKVKDAPWTLMNQLAMQMNNALSAFQPAYIILKEILQLKAAYPSPTLAVELQKNVILFHRNYYWKRIDDAVARFDNARAVYYIDKLMPLAQGEHEKSNLAMLRSKALKRNDEPIKGCLIMLAGVLGAMMVLNFLFADGGGKGKEKNTPPSRWQAFWQSFYPDDKTVHTVPFNSSQIRVLNKAGLEEVKPPDQPTERKLTLAEIRHVVFQKARLEHLSQQELTPEEMEVIQKLWEEWRRRGEFYKYDSEDRERAEIEAQRNMTSLLEDAEVIKKEISGAGDEQSEEEAEEKFKEHKILLSLESPTNVNRILRRLAQYGYYKEAMFNGTWTSDGEKALAAFKTALMGQHNSKWNIETQEALLGK